MAKSVTKSPDPKPAAKKAPAEKPAAKVAAKPAAKEAAKEAPPKKTNAGLAKPVQPSKELAAVVGSHAIPRTEVISKVWEHIRKHNLQNPENKREILADDKLKAVFGKDRATMFEMNKLLSNHLK